MTSRRGRAATLAVLVWSGVAPQAGAQAGAQAGGPPFEGAVTLRMSAKTPQGVQRQQMEYLMRNGKLRVNVPGPMGGMAMIAVPQEKKMYMLVAAQNTYMEMPLPEAAAAAKSAVGQPDDVKVTRTGRMETVAGFSCEHVQLASRSGAADMCLSKELGRFVNPMEGLRQGSVAPWQKQIANEFPLKVTLPDGTVPLEVTRVERKRLPDDLFAVPEHYRKMEMPQRRPPV